MNNFLRHFGMPRSAVDKNDRNFPDAKSFFPCFKCHFNLKGITVRFNLIEIESIKNVSPETFKAARGIANRQPGNYPGILVGKITQQ